MMSACTEGHRVDALTFRVFYQALGHGVVVGIAMVAHGADEGPCGRSRSRAGRAVYLGSTIRVVDASSRRVARSNRGVERGQSQVGVDLPAHGIADDGATRRP